MSQRSRRGFLLSLIVPFTFTAAACAKPSPSQQMANQFIEAYYVQINLKSAEVLTSGLAKEKLDKQMQLVQGAGAEPLSEKPRVTFALIKKDSDSADSATYVYEVRTHVEDVGKRMVFVKLRQESGAWKVTQFTEDDAPPTS